MIKISKLLKEIYSEIVKIRKKIEMLREIIIPKEKVKGSTS